MFILDESAAFKISTPAETYIYDILPLGDGIAVISSDNKLRLLDPQNLEGPPVNVIEKVSSDVTCVKDLDSTGGLMVCTAGRDGKVKIFDPRSGAKIGELTSGNPYFLLWSFFLLHSGFSFTPKPIIQFLLASQFEILGVYVSKCS
jgi:SEL1 protein